MSKFNEEIDSWIQECHRRPSDTMVYNKAAEIIIKEAERFCMEPGLSASEGVRVIGELPAFQLAEHLKKFING